MAIPNPAAAASFGGAAVQWLLGSKVGRWLLPLGLGGAALTYSDNMITSAKNAIGATGAISGPGGVASNVTENGAQTDLFSKTVTGVRNMFVGIMEFFKVIGDLVKGKISLSEIMSGKISASEAFSSATARQNDNRVGGPDIGSALNAAAVPAAVATAGIAATVVASKVTTGSWNPLTMVTSGFSRVVSLFTGNKATASVADNLVNPAINTADDAARAFTTVADDAARLLTPDEIARAAKGLDNAAPLADDATRATIGLADDAARATMGLGGKAKIVGALAVGLGAGYSWLTGENPVATTAQAAVDPTAPVDTTTTVPAQTELATGAPIEATLIAGSGAVVAATSLGVKAIPLVGGVVTAADTLWNTGSYLFQGEFSKAGTELVAGAGLTVGATGGFLTYGLGEAWHAGVRDSAIAVIGSDAEIGKAPLRTVFEMATGVNTDMATAPAATPTVEAFKAAVANSEIRVPVAAPAMEYDMMGNATGFSAPVSEGLDLGNSFASAKDNAPAVTADATAAAARRRPARGQPVLESHLN